MRYTVAMGLLLLVTVGAAAGLVLGWLTKRESIVWVPVAAWLIFIGLAWGFDDESDPGWFPSYLLLVLVSVGAALGGVSLRRQWELRKEPARTRH